MSIGQNIRKYRKEKGYTQKSLAEAINVSVQAISKWETDAGAPDISQIVPLARALEISTDMLLDYTGTPEGEDFARIRQSYVATAVFREQTHSEENYARLAPYCTAHPQDTEVAIWCLKCLVDLVAAGTMAQRSRSELLAECEKYAGCVFRYETDPDRICMTKFILSRGYTALDEPEKAQRLLEQIPVVFGNRLYWEAEIAQADREFDTAMLRCRESFAGYARYVSRCIRMAGEICEGSDAEGGMARRVEYEEYMLRMLNAFLSGGDYIPCRQVYQKGSLLLCMIEQCLVLGRRDRACQLLDMLLEFQMQFHAFLRAPKGKHTLLFADNDSFEYQMETKARLDAYVARAKECLS